MTAPVSRAFLGANPKPWSPLHKLPPDAICKQYGGYAHSHSRHDSVARFTTYETRQARTWGVSRRRGRPVDQDCHREYTTEPSIANLNTYHKPSMRECAETSLKASVRLLIAPLHGLLESRGDLVTLALEFIPARPRYRANALPGNAVSWLRPPCPGGTRCACQRGHESRRSTRMLDLLRMLTPHSSACLDLPTTIYSLMTEGRIGRFAQPKQL